MARAISRLLANLVRMKISRLLGARCNVPGNRGRRDGDAIPQSLSNGCAAGRRINTVVGEHGVELVTNRVDEGLHEARRDRRRDAVMQFDEGEL